MLLSILSIPGLAESEQLSWDLAKAVIQWQSTIAILGVTVLIGITVLIFAISWIHSSIVHKHEIEEITVSIETKVAEKMQEITTASTKEIREEVNKMVSETRKDIAKRMDLFDADKAKILTLININSEFWENAVFWTATAVVAYAKIKNQHWLGIMVDSLNECLKKCDKLTDSNREQVEACLPYIPEILYEKKEQIKAKLAKLPPEAPQEPEKT